MAHATGAKQSTKASKHPKATPNFPSNQTNGERQQCIVKKGKQMKLHRFEGEKMKGNFCVWN
jgi:hypothetical protein